ncbi:cytochrome P450 [Setomelanomma holmii]|uniref:Cytochrome P450 n=1 Tax=Setomelanomma holmii TaxID=210430 RepID=A0A9P4LPZ5_9PLEO|nr:cytochrome P450 [Setomelanomma holmii]
MAYLSTIAVTLLAIPILYVFTRFLILRKHTLPLPPGPKSIPVLGNINDLPKPGALEYLHWLAHKDTYGPISSVTILGQTLIIINNADMALDLLRDRSAINSGRPHMVFAGEMVGWNKTLGLSQPSERFKLFRKNFAKVASKRGTLEVFDRVQEEESAHFLLNLLESPEELFDHIRKEAGAVILRITYGYTPNAKGRDPLVDLAGKAMKEFDEASVPGKYLVDSVPFLRFLPDWCPGTEFKDTARSMARQLTRTIEVPYAFVKQQMREERHKSSYLSQAIEDIGADADMEQIHKWSAASMYNAGADTTVTSLMIFFLAMMQFPDVQKKAQEELDRVIGHRGLPVSSDKESLSYLEAVVRETHRWHPVAPMAIPHTSSEEATYRGYRIPKGAMLMPNTWWFTHDPLVYHNPMTFNPDRFLGASPEPDPRIYTFGYGRRICPGRYVADNALFITIAQVLAVFNISKPVENGVTIEPKVEFESGVISHPVPYKCSIEPRSERHRELIMKSEEVYPWRQSDAHELERLGVS